MLPAILFFKTTFIYKCFQLWFIIFFYVGHRTFSLWFWAFIFLHLIQCNNIHTYIHTYIVPLNEIYMNCYFQKPWFITIIHRVSTIQRYYKNIFYLLIREQVVKLFFSFKILEWTCAPGAPPWTSKVYGSKGFSEGAERPLSPERINVRPPPWYNSWNYNCPRLNTLDSWLISKELSLCNKLWFF